MHGPSPDSNTAKPSSKKRGERSPYSVFLATDYRQYLEKYCAFNDDQRGVRGRLAESASCQPSYFSRVLSEEAHLSLDQLYGVARHLGLAEAEWEFFNLLWLHARAGTTELKARYLRQLEALRLSHVSQIGGPSVVSSRKQWDRYLPFSTSWHHTAIYVALEIPGMNRAADIAQELGLKRPRVEAVLRDLEAMELAREEREGEWQQTVNTFVMDRHSPIFQIHRLHWYALSLRRFHDDPAMGYHGGTCFAATEKQIGEVREKIEKMIRDILKSPPEKGRRRVAYFGVDLFHL